MIKVHQVIIIIILLGLFTFLINERYQLESFKGGKGNKRVPESVLDINYGTSKINRIWKGFNQPVEMLETAIKGYLTPSKGISTVMNSGRMDTYSIDFKSVTFALSCILCYQLYVC